jgi:hypothetical protein
MAPSGMLRRVAVTRATRRNFPEGAILYLLPVAEISGRARNGIGNRTSYKESFIALKILTLSSLCIYSLLFL